MADLQDEFSLACLTIAHNLALVEHLSSTVAVIYLGRVVESGPTDAMTLLPGCAFHPRCPHAMPVCRVILPSARSASDSHLTSFHLLPEPEFAA